MDTSPDPLQVTSFSLERAMYTPLVVVTQGMGLKLLALRASRACVHESYRTVANKEAVLHGFRAPRMALYLDQAQRKWAKMPIFHFFPGSGPTTHFLSCCLKVWVSSICIWVLTEILPVGTLVGFIHPQLLDGTKNKVPSRFEGKLRVRLMDKVHLVHKITLSRLEKRGCFI